MTEDSANHALSLRWLSTGIGIAALVLGLLVGASQSPLAGVAVTAMFGFLGAAFVAWANSTARLQAPPTSKEGAGAASPIRQDKPEADHRSIQVRPNEWNIAAQRTLDRTGRLISLFFLVFFIGIAAGASIRVWGSGADAERHFPWSHSSPPKSPYDAVDWILVQEKLRALGYTEDQVASLYAIQAGVWKEEPFSIGQAERVKPISSLLGDVKELVRPDRPPPVPMSIPPKK